MVPFNRHKERPPMHLAMTNVTESLAVRHDNMADMMSQASAWLLQRPTCSVRMTDAFSGRVIYAYYT
jgi:hypothetical protein